MADLAASLIATAFGVALVTTLVLPGRETAAVTREGFSGLAKLVNATLGRG